ncbi:MAG: efflux RND transporter periplasmic adaptor subunit [Thermoflexales bacterium]|nr:efflux RND transporter periplasmic adaptor subunit [Thermoflexales bacterium]
MKKRKRRKTWPIVTTVVALIVLIGGGYWYYAKTATQSTDAKEPALQTTTVRKGDIVITAVGSGNLVPTTELDLGFRTSGTLLELAVQVGEYVQAGQLLARLDNASAHIQLAQAELNLEQVKAKLETSHRTMTQTMEIAQSNLEAAQAAYDALVQASTHTSDRLTSARVNLAQAQTQLSDAQAAYDVAWDPARDWELGSGPQLANALDRERESTLRALKKAQDDVQVARANYNLVVLGLDDDDALKAAWTKVLVAQQALEDARSGADSQAAEWAVRQAELSLESAQLAMDNTRLLAPAAGTVVAVVAGEGEAVGAGPILTLADLGTPLVRFYLEESDLGKAAVGHKVTVVFDAYPGREFTGSLVRVDPVLVTVGGTPAVQAWAALDESENDQTLPAGLTAEVEITAGEAYKTLLVPVQALRELESGQYAVFVVAENGQLKLRPVEIGLRDFANAQVLSGLEQGELISTGTVETK